MTDSRSFIARFTVTGYEPSTLPGLDDPEWVAALVMHKSFTEGIIGESILHFVSSGGDESPGYLAAERITGSVDGVPGQLTVHHGALRSGEDPTAFGHIIPGSGTGAFNDWTGGVKIIHDDRGPYFVFTLAG